MHPPPTPPSEPPVPPALRAAFIVHFVADLLFAVPLFVAPAPLLTAFGWTTVDVVSARLVAAALFGIGIESWRARDASRAQYRTMLGLKVIWSASAALGLAWALVEGAHGRPPMLYAVFAIFAAFHGLWLSWWLRLRRPA